MRFFPQEIFDSAVKVFYFSLNILTISLRLTEISRAQDVATSSDAGGLTPPKGVPSFSSGES